MSYAASLQASRFMLSHPAHWVAMGFGSGLSPWAPGTVGTLWAWAAYLLLDHWLDTEQLAWVLVAALPSASNSALLAERFGADSTRITRVILLSTALAFPSFSAWVAWYKS